MSQEHRMNFLQTQLSPLAALTPSPLRCRMAPLSQAGDFRELMRLLGSTGEALREVSVPLSIWRVRPQAQILLEGQASETVYVLRSGSVKSVRTLEDGYEQVLAIAYPGDLIGIEALHGGQASTGWVALEDCTVFALPARDAAVLQRECPPFETALWRAVTLQISHAAETAEMVAAVSSEARVARFLLWTAQRMAALGRSPRRLVLRMGRRDIASLLSVAHETVSRSLTSLAEAGCIEVNIRDIEIRDLDLLNNRAKSTRGATRLSESAPVARRELAAA
jgi:CRP/FNR family transcriptional regulator, anaerobic regulatory protein